MSTASLTELVDGGPDGPDGRGHDLLAARVAALPAWLAGMVDAPLPFDAGALRSLGRVVCTGVGRSEAQARYFAGLLHRYTTVAAGFRPLAEFVDAPREGDRGQALVVFSQGMSDNAWLALRRAGSFGRAILFTAATEDGLERAGRPDRARRRREFREAGGEVVGFPPEDEYQILIRVLGPLTGLVAARQAAAVVSGGGLARLTRADLAPVLAALAPSPESRGLAGAVLAGRREWAGGGMFLLPDPLAECAQNLAWKWVEGLFWPAPALTGCLGLAHGPFQQLVSAPRPMVRFVPPPDDPQAELAGRAARMLEEAGLASVPVSL
ncbi:MAG: creatininase, partial [Verrucomicrobiota bacterium]